jgi:hypothetical protein
VIEAGSDGAQLIPDGDRTSELLELADALMKRARTLAFQSDQLIAVLDDAARRLVESGRGLETSPLPAPLSLLNRQVDAEKPKRPEPERPAENGSAEAPVSDGARMLILQMSIRGRSQGEIAKRLHEDFGIDDADEVLERVAL